MLLPITCVKTAMVCEHETVTSIGCPFFFTGKEISNRVWCCLIHFNTNFCTCIQFRITLKSMKSQCHGQRKSHSMQLNSRPVSRTEFYTIVSFGSVIIKYKVSMCEINQNGTFDLNPYSTCRVIPCILVSNVQRTTNLSCDHFIS